MSKKNLPPGPGGLKTLNGAQDLRSELERGTGVALDLVRVGTAPRVGGVPCDGVAVAPVESGALLAVGILGLVPEVVVDDELVSGGCAPLVAELDAASIQGSVGRDGGGIAHGGQSQGDERHGGDEGLHGCCWNWCSGWMRVVFEKGARSGGMKSGLSVDFILFVHGFIRRSAV